ncbi:hypothetical protein BH721_04440 [Clostridium baratii]|uniref:hypothetical protein n=1 Tax=Clostridium baratii TaxID=1561 RepID=UPI0009A3D698|nr:hypothetical protein [Clostridium baratii]OPF52509.1 hypothetical protein A1M12_10645 [Clostridium baratii]OPF55957.1 hypothetical protein BH721_04440 [Clostridium baratii]OPF58449.1 hypothetical protein BH724_06140 [Clostridium baratii]OPF59661.1 hypothetical protein BH725_03485 [Clostridium baratii]
MGKNSIRSKITKKDIISEIKLFSSANKEKKVIIVEGIDDYKFIRKFIKNDVLLKESFSGKDGVIAIKEFFEKDSNIIGILDKDHDEKLIDKGIFYYDFSSMETMISSHIECFKNVCCECYLNEINAEKLRKELLNNLINISLLRRYNAKNKLKIKINKIAIHNILREDSSVCKLKLLEMVDLKNGSNNLWKQNRDIISKYIDEHSKNQYTLEELLNLTRGHDFAYMLNIYCSKIKGKDYGVDIIQGFLRCSFTIENFKNTKMWTSLKEYSDKENVYFFNC